MRTMTFRSESKSRGCAEFGPSHLIYTDTVREDGTVVSKVRGNCDGEYVDSVREWKCELPTPIDFESVRAARIGSGWSVVA